MPFSIQNQKFYSDAFKLRTLFVSPHAEQRNFFYGVNFEFSIVTPPFSQSRFSMEIRPILGVRNDEYEFIINPIVDVHFGKYAEQRFAPAARVGRKFGEDLFAGFEYYADLGQIWSFGKFTDQQHTLFAVTDFKLGVFDVNFGVGYGLTPAPDRWVIKSIIGYAFPVPGDKPVRANVQRALDPSIRWRTLRRDLFNPDADSACAAPLTVRISSNLPTRIASS